MNQLDHLAHDMLHTFLADFGEEIVYTPYQGSPRTVRAVIKRDVPQAIPGLSGSSSYQHELEIANHSHCGVVVVNKGKDTLAFPGRIGGPMMNFTVKQIIEQDQGCWVLGVAQC